MEHSREFVTSCVVGKDIIPRVGLHQLETLRHNLIQALHKSQEPKVQSTLKSLNLLDDNFDIYKSRNQQNQQK